MNSSRQLVQCLKCRCQVRKDRLRNHLEKVHGSQESGIDSKKPIKEVVISSNSLTIETFGQVKDLVSSWLRRKKGYLYNPDNVKTLTIMALQDFMNYSLDEISRIDNKKINQEQHKKSTVRLRITYEQMIKHLEQVFISYSKNYTHQKTGNQYYLEDEDVDISVDWYTCNSVDRMDGSKFLGFTRREYEDSRFGSFPIHDDYSEESWADDNPWE